MIDLALFLPDKSNHAFQFVVVRVRYVYSRWGLTLISPFTTNMCSQAETSQRCVPLNILHILNVLQLFMTP